MKTSIMILLSFGLLLGGCSDSSDSSSGAGTTLDRGGSSGESSTTLSPQETDDLVFMREEEKLARDVYRTLYTHWNLKIFNNISNAEQTHMNSLGSMIVKFGIDDPITNDRTGSFNNQTLAALYDSLVSRGKQSKDAAIGVGKEIEILDISDLEKAISATSNRELIQVYQRLMNGSYNHLDAFNSFSG